ncbi:MAG: 2-oxo acid dehydrogenase subunit E2 [Deltaproteobacteria bacterium]|nr:MAG: 2-oxo acid dehydrogenase subunit E2 [Deltaproteobacteria bacterium]
MLRDLLMPKLGLTMAEGLIIEWKVAPGQAFAKGEPLLVVETEKIAMEIEAEFTGMMAEILVSQGSIAPVGSVIARWRATADTEEASRRSPASATRPSGGDIEVRPSAAGHPIVSVSVLPVPPPESRPKGTPLARRLARQHGIDLDSVRGTGPSGRITVADVEAAAKASALPPIVDAQKGSAAPSIDLGTRVPAGPIQAAMARRLTAVKQEVPHFYLAAEAEVTTLLALRESLNTDPGYPRITINHMVVAAVGRALLDLPLANRVWDDGQLVTFASTDVGIAVHTPRGLFVPILRDAGRAKLDAVAEESARLVEKAREGRLEANDMTGGAMAVSNAGMFNVSYMTPIINPGHSAILGVASVRRIFRPDAGGRPALRQEIGLVLACDHRVFDGFAGLELLNRVIAGLENPFWLLRNPGPKR